MELDRYIRANELARLLGISRATVWNWTKDGRLPKPVKLSPHVTAWKASEVAKAIEARGAGDE